MVTDKQHAHNLIEQLAPDQLQSAVRLLESILSHPVARSINSAPPDDEPLSQEDSEALDRADFCLKHNEPIPHEQVLAEFGLTLKDFPLKENDV